MVLAGPTRPASPDASSPEVVLPCGSRSISRTRNFWLAKATARLIAVVVLPTPPFWLAIATIRPTTQPQNELSFTQEDSESGYCALLVGYDQRATATVQKCPDILRVYGAGCSRRRMSSTRATVSVARGTP